MEPFFMSDTEINTQDIDHLNLEHEVERAQAESHYHDDHGEVIIGSRGKQPRFKE